jgi:EAL domain-containing protein (putative c-di-GMP-specific phosphodiesterase class I)
MGTAISLNRAESSPCTLAVDLRAQRNDEMKALISIDNLAHIQSAYGPTAAEAAIASMDLILDQMRAGGCRIFTRSPGLVDIAFGQRPVREAAESLEAAITRLTIEPIRLGDLRVHLALSSQGVSRDVRPPCSAVASPCGPASNDEVWIAQYRNDMSVAVEAFSALAEDRLHLNWQPILSPHAPTEILYQEGLARLFGRDGQPIPTSDFVPALERLGLARAFDHEIMALALYELENFPAAFLGINISGQSACVDGWWASMFRRLERSPQVAQRLIVEITETAALSPGVHDFVFELHRLGCRFALDDFGVGHASIRNALMLNPDIIKIDAFFLRQVDPDVHEYPTLEHLIGIAASLAQVVVVEGVETEAQSQFIDEIRSHLAEPNGGCWQQGYHFGRPTSWRGWRYTSAEPKVVPLSQLTAASTGFRRRESYVGLGRR